MLDDGNVRDGDLEFGKERLVKATLAPHVRAIGNAIIELLEGLTLEQREIWWQEKEL